MLRKESQAFRHKSLLLRNELKVLRAESHHIKNKSYRPRKESQMLSNKSNQSHSLIGTSQVLRKGSQELKIIHYYLEMS